MGPRDLPRQVLLEGDQRRKGPTGTAVAPSVGPCNLDIDHNYASLPWKWICATAKHARVPTRFAAFCAAAALSIAVERQPAYTPKERTRSVRA